MPIHIELANLVIEKRAIAAKYPGGIDGFRAHHAMGSAENCDQEDGELFSLSAMGADVLQAEATRLIALGLAYDERDGGSNDLALITRYGGVAVRPAWLRTNGLYAWHRSCPAALQEKVERLGRSTMDQLDELVARGEVVFGTLVE